MSTVYETVGVLGSGKSTWARRFIVDRPKTKIVCPDAFRMMLNGEYKYLVELDDVITQSCFDTAVNLLKAGYDVVMDCGNLTTDPDRRGKWKQLPADKFIAVVMPVMDDEWHVQNRMKAPHWNRVDWREIIKREKAAHEPATTDEFDEIWRIGLAYELISRQRKETTP